MTHWKGEMASHEHVTRWVPSINPAICYVFLVNFHSFCTALYYWASILWSLVSPNQPFEGWVSPRTHQWFEAQLQSHLLSSMVLVELAIS